MFVYNLTPEIRTLSSVLRVSRLERFHSRLEDCHLHIAIVHNYREHMGWFATNSELYIPRSQRIEEHMH